MALQQLLGDSSVTNNSLVFEQVHFQNALGLDPPGAVILSLEQGVSDLSWNFAIRTTVVAEPHSKEISHGHGVISILANPMLDMFERLVTGPMDRMAKNEDAERLMSKRAYGLFARVVEYDNFFRGIRSIAMDGQEAIATVALPETQPNRRESTAWKVCDTVSVDAFIQVLGLLMNTSDMISGDEVTVMVGLDRAVISTACRMEDVASWNVYTKFATTGDRQPVGDVFVCSPQSKLVALLSGCRFANLPISKLERALDSANSGRSAERPETSRAAQVSSCASSSMPSGLQTPATDGSGPAAGDLDMALKCLVAEYTGASHSDVSGEAVLSDLGLDSLASIELAGELASKFGLEMSSTDLMMCTLDRLSRLLGAFDLSFLGANQSKSSTKASLGLAVLEENHAEPLGLQAKGRRQKFFEILADISGVRPEKISLDSTLADVGIDSLSSVDLKQELEDEFAARIDDQLMVQTVGELLARLGMPESTSIAGTECDEPGSTVQAVPVPGSQDMERPLNLPNPLQLLRESDVHFDDSAYQRGFLGYWAEVAPLQDELLLAYIVEGFSALGVDLRQIRCGEMVPQFSYLTHKYDKLVARLWEILKYHGIVSINNAGDRMRSSRAVDPRPSSELQAAFEKRFPAYQDEASLIGLTGPRLADCLSGKEDAVAIMFGNAASLRIMENFYGRSPMMSTMTEQLVIYLTSLLRGVTVSRPVRILEVGAGTGGTTGRLAEALERYGIAARYTFTDISASLVSKAKAKFKKYAWMEFSTFNLEKEVPEGFRNEFDVVISANCVHATTDRTASCRRLREALKPEGFMVLSEVTRIMDWYDVCFGLLDGWWLVEDGSAYPLQPAEAWMSTFAAAGFASASYSEGPTAEANSQQLLVACNSHWDAPRPTMEDGNVDGDTDGGVCQLETVVYKETNGIVIHADVFFPRQAPALPMPVALMIHGGGHMTLSRKAIRPAQTRHLISNGFLPVSIDYRLCPEVSLEDGPMADVCSAYGWVRTELPRMAAQRGLAVEGETVVVVGWSTGGHLAMSLGWTAERAGLPPPTAVLSLYGPVDFESGELDSKRLPWLPGRAMSLERIMAALPTTPITGYDDSAKGDDTNLGWVRAGDARSELVLALFKEGIGLPLLLDGLRGAASRLSADGGEKGSWLAAASAERVASISPLARLRAGQYKVPTYVIHGTADQVAPFAGAERFVRELGARGVEHGFLALQGVDHIHDLRLRPGSEAWAAQVEPGYEFLFRLAGRRKL
ncbi:hypothetical protein CDD83_5579 [Cordyceps sp. RAO-2017]|nr:hypothetical protein CDD83_5579 [Cordyceps sp. RAO-2017]